MLLIPVLCWACDLLLHTGTEALVLLCVAAVLVQRTKLRRNQPPTLTSLWKW